jgi:DNA-binding NarL/FixJ family response regulator
MPIRLVDQGFEPPIRVLVADDQALVRGGLRALLDGEPDIAVVAEAADAEQAFAWAQSAPRPGVVLIDSELPGLDGPLALRRFSSDRALDGIQIVVLMASDADDRVFGALRAGVSGFLLKDAAPSELVQAVRTVAAGAGALSSTVARRLLDELAALPDIDRARPGQLDELTARETEVVALVATGMSNAEIAEQLVISPATAKTHVSRALSKLAARDRAQLVTLAYETRLVVPGPVHVAA